MNSIKPLELARLAATCEGSTSKRKVDIALELLKASAEALAPEPAEKADEISEITDRQFNLIPFDHWLAGIMPKSKKEHRRSLFLEFLTGEFEARPCLGVDVVAFTLATYRGTKPAGGSYVIDPFAKAVDPATAARRCLAQLAESEVRNTDALRSQVARFLIWKSNRDSKVRIERAKKGARALKRGKR